MKVMNCPEELPYQPDYSDYENEHLRETAHREKLVAWLRANGWDGPRTGEILYEPFADGAAQYVYADSKGAVLIHLPYRDAWDSPNVEFLPKREVLKRLDRSRDLAAAFAAAQADRAATSLQEA